MWKLAQPALVSEADFIAAQEVSALPRPDDGARRCYQLVGLLRCALCGRRLESYWSHGRAAYRCQHGHSSAQPRGPDGRQNVYVREDRMVANIRRLLRHDGLLELSGRPEQQIVRYLRQHRLVVACTEATCRLEPEYPK
jgi:site-specific DNA recombinase